MAPPYYGMGGQYGQNLILNNKREKMRGGGFYRNFFAPSPMATPPAATPPPPPSFDPFSNPYFQQMTSMINASGLADAANTRAAIQQALIGFGFVPEGFRDQLGALDDVTRSLIEKNTQTGISGYARLLEGHKSGIRDAVNRLQARGLRRSGAKGAALRKNQLGFDRARADAIAQLLGGIGGLYSGYANNEYARQMQLAQMMAYVYQNYFTPPPAATPPAPTYPGGGGSSGGGPNDSFPLPPPGGGGKYWYY